MNIPNQKIPCSNCPFRKDCLKGWLGRERMEEILQEDNFVCHKKPSFQCAGHMILNNDRNLFIRIAKVMKVYIQLSGHELIFESKTQCIEHHDN